VVQAEAAPAAVPAPLIDVQAMAAVQAEAAPLQAGQARVAQAQGGQAQPAGKAVAANATAKTATEAASVQAHGLFALADAAGPSAEPAVGQGGGAGAEQSETGADTPAPGGELAQADAAPPESKPDAAGQLPQAPGQPAAPASSGVANAQAHGGTVSALAAQIVRKSEGKASRFEVQLDPLGLGQVTVSVRIDAQGRLSAALAFDNPAAAAQLNARSGELRAALEQAGFDLSQGGLSFDTAAGGSGGQAQGGDPGRAGDQGPIFRGRAFGAVSQALDQADLGALAPTRRAASGLDLRI
jgi:hypothetical protein